MSTDLHAELEELRARAAECEHYDEQLDNVAGVIAAAREVCKRWENHPIVSTHPQVLDLMDALDDFDRVDRSEPRTARQLRLQRKHPLYRRLVRDVERKKRQGAQ